MDDVEDTQGGGQQQHQQLTKNPMEKMRIRLAAEGYDGNSNNFDYDKLSDDDMKDSKGKMKPSRCAGMLSPIIVLFSLCLLVVIGFALLAVLLKLKLDDEHQTCQSVECHVTSGAMLAKMDTTVDRCEDFYEYSCSAFIRSPLTPPERPVYNTLNIIDFRNKAIVRQLMETSNNTYQNKLSDAVRKAQDFYAACLDLNGAENRGVTPILQLISRVGSWSVIGSLAPYWNLTATLAAIHSYGFSPLFSLSVTADDANSSINILSFDQKGLSLSSPESYIGNSTEKYHSAFVDYLVDLATILGASGATVRQQAEDVWDFEMELAKIFVSPNDRADVHKLYNVMTLTQFEDLIPSTRFNLGEYLQKAYGTTFPGTERILVRVPSYFYKLGYIIDAAAQETVANYVSWYMVRLMTPYLSTPFRLAASRLKMRLYNIDSESPRWETCLGATNDYLGFATGALYVDKYFSQRDKANAKEVFLAILDSFKTRLPQMTWMDSVTLSLALDKANAIRYDIGYPDYITDLTQLDNHYQLLIVTNNSFENILNANAFDVNYNRHKLRQIPDPDEWDMYPSEVNAYYNPSTNGVVIPAGILQSPLFHSSFPKSLIYGGIGYIMGHEVTHGFDNTGRNYDKYGNMVDWWTNHSSQEFTKRTKCLVDEYNSFMLYGHHLNGLTTLGENIADNGGVKVSYDAYQSWRNDGMQEDIRLPGLNMTGNQQFFLAYAQVWCAYYNKEFAIQDIVTNPHSNARYRVNGALQNFPKFAEAFSCSSTSKMNPSTKCSVW